MKIYKCCEFGLNFCSKKFFLPPHYHNSKKRNSVVPNHTIPPYHTIPYHKKTIVHTQPQQTIETKPKCQKGNKGAPNDKEVEVVGSLARPRGRVDVHPIQGAALRRGIIVATRQKASLNNLTVIFGGKEDEILLLLLLLLLFTLLTREDKISTKKSWNN